MGCFMELLMALLSILWFGKHATDKRKFGSLNMMMTALFVVGVAASQFEGPPCRASYKPFEYTGCFKDVAESPALNWRSYLDQNDMTIEKCTAFCKGNANRYAGLTYYGVCHCGMSIEVPRIDEAICNYPCSGDKTQVCGGEDAMSVYEDPTFPPLGEAKLDGFVPVGCALDEMAIRVLAYRQEMDQSKMSNKVCQRRCMDKGYPFAGTEFGSECWCGAMFAPATAFSNSDECNMPCNGDKNDICGGSQRLSVYRNKGLMSREPCKEVGDKPPTSRPISTPPLTSAPTTALEDPTTTVKSTTTVIVKSTTTVNVKSTTSVNDCAFNSSGDCTVSKTVNDGYNVHSGITTPNSASGDPTTTIKSTTAVKVKSTTAVKVKPTTTAKVKSTAVTNPSGDCAATKTITAGHDHPSTTPCEYSVGGWCSRPLPPFHDEPTCQAAFSQCIMQVFPCFAKAGWHAHHGCIDYKMWCLQLGTYCIRGALGFDVSKDAFLEAHPPQRPSAPGCHGTTVTTTPTQPTTTTTKHSQCPIPTPTSLCRVGNEPLGGIEAPVVACNDISHQHHAGHPFKMYHAEDSEQCPTYPRWILRAKGSLRASRIDGLRVACADACREQMRACVANFAEEHKTDAGRLMHGDRNHGHAVKMCRRQAHRCYQANRHTSGWGKCTSYCSGPW